MFPIMRCVIFKHNSGLLESCQLSWAWAESETGADANIFIICEEHRWASNRVKGANVLKKSLKSAFF